MRRDNNVFILGCWLGTASEKCQIVNWLVCRLLSFISSAPEPFHRCNCNQWWLTTDNKTFVFVCVCVNLVRETRWKRRKKHFLIDWNNNGDRLNLGEVLIFLEWRIQIGQLFLCCSHQNPVGREKCNGDFVFNFCSSVCMLLPV